MGKQHIPCGFPGTYTNKQPFKYLINLVAFQGRAVDMKTLTLIEEPSEENLAEAEDEFERLLNESS